MDISSLIKKKPVIAPDVFVAPTATVTGHVEIGAGSSVWFGAVIRGDRDGIRIGNRTNIQDNAVIHGDPGSPAIIGDECVIGHLAIVHGARLGNRVLVGMHATILNNARIGNNVIIGAGALITAGTEIPDNSMVIGMPAKVVRTLREEEVAGIARSAETYAASAKVYMTLNNEGRD